MPLQDLLSSLVSVRSKRATGAKRRRLKPSDNRGPGTTESLEARALLTALGDAYSAESGAVLTINSIDGVLANDTSDGGDPLTAVLDNGPSQVP